MAVSKNWLINQKLSCAPVNSFKLNLFNIKNSLLFFLMWLNLLHFWSIIVWELEDENDHRNYEHCLSSSENKAWKKILTKWPSLTWLISSARRALHQYHRGKCSSTTLMFFQALVSLPLHTIIHSSYMWISHVHNQLECYSTLLKSCTDLQTQWKRECNSISYNNNDICHLHRDILWHFQQCLVWLQGENRPFRMHAAKHMLQCE